MLGFGAPDALVGHVSMGLTYGDFNGDGFQDIATVNQDDTVSVVLGYGDGTFAPSQAYGISGASASSSQLIVAGDFDGDGSLDLAVAEYSNRVQILAGSKSGTFTAQTPITINGASSSAGLVTADFNGDGKADLMVFGEAGQLAVLTNTGGFTFMESDQGILSGAPYALAVADVDADGRPDVVATTKQSTVVVALNKTGGFSPETPVTLTSSATAVALADVNGDTKPDAVVTLNDGTVRYLLGDGKGGLGAPVSLGTVGSAATNVAVRDVSGDNLPDIVALNGNEVTVFPSTGIGAWGGAAGFNPGSTGGLALADVNGDGIADVLVGDQTLESVSVLLSAPHGILAGATLTTTNPGQSAPLLVDINGDGHLDAVTVVAANNEVEVFLNTGDGTFGAGVTYGVGTGANPTSVTAGDFNGDGKMDLAVASPGLVSVGILLGTATGFSPVRQFPASYTGGLVVGDFNNDKALDLVSWTTSGGMTFLAGSGSGTFAAGVDSTTTIPANLKQLVAAKLNGTRLDLVGFANEYDSQTGFYKPTALTRLSNGDGTFAGGTDFSASNYGLNASGGIAVGDFNKDGKLDAMTFWYDINSGGQLFDLFAGDGTGSLTPGATPMNDPFLVNQPAYAIASGDFDGDGDLDVAVLEQSPREIGIMKGDGKGGLKKAFARSISSGISSLVAADLTGDGRPSLYFTGSPGSGEMLDLCK